MGDIVSILTPVLLHLAVSMAVSLAMQGAAFGMRFDAAAVTTAANLFVIPIAAWMYRRDSARTHGPAQTQDCADAQNCTQIQNCTAAQGTRMQFRADAKAPQRMQEDMDARHVRTPDAHAIAHRTGERQPRLRLAAFGLLCFAAGGLMNLAWSGVLNLLQVTEHFSNQQQELLFAGDYLVQILGLGVVVPLSEELIFRGLTYRRMRRLFPVRTAVILSALLFAVYHGNVVQMLFAFPMAVALAMVFERGKLFAFPLLFHMGANLTAIFFNFFL